MWLSIVEFIGPLALKYGLQYLEQKYPGLQGIMNQIIYWLEAQTKLAENPDAVAHLQKHIDTLCAAGMSCPSDVKP